MGLWEHLCEYHHISSKAFNDRGSYVLHSITWASASDYCTFYDVQKIAVSHSLHYLSLLINTLKPLTLSFKVTFPKVRSSPRNRGELALFVVTVVSCLHKPSQLLNNKTFIIRPPLVLEKVGLSTRVVSLSS